MLPKHLLEQSYVAAGKLAESPQNSQPVGTGPYRFQEWKSGEKVVLVANPDYFEGRPYLCRIVYRVIPSQATIFLELKAQGVDYRSSLTAHPVHAADRVPRLPEGLPASSATRRAATPSSAST